MALRVTFRDKLKALSAVRGKTDDIIVAVNKETDVSDAECQVEIRVRVESSFIILEQLDKLNDGMKIAVEKCVRSMLFFFSSRLQDTLSEKFRSPSI